MNDQRDVLVNQLLGAAWRSLNDAAVDLSLVVAVAPGEALSHDAYVLARATEREAEGLVAVAVRWQERKH